MSSAENDSFQTEAIENFDFLTRLHEEVKTFKINNSAKILAVFRSPEGAKFDKTVYPTKETRTTESKVHVSTTSSCAYALAQYYDFWKEAKQEVFGRKEFFRNLSEYWNYIVKSLAQREGFSDPQGIDEFSVLTLLSESKEIQKKVCQYEGAEKIDAQSDNIISKAVNALCYQFIENRLSYGENPHPWVYYRFLTTLDDWKNKIDSRRLRERLEAKYGKTVLEIYSVKNKFPTALDQWTDKRDLNKLRETLNAKNDEAHSEEKSMEMEVQDNKSTKPRPDVKEDKALFFWFWNEIYETAKYELYRQVAFHESKEETLFDVKRLIYSLLIVSWKNRYSNPILINRAIDIIFEEQLNTGLLPISHVVSNDFVMIPNPSQEKLAKNRPIDRFEIFPTDISRSPILLSFECFGDMLRNEYVRKKLMKHYQWLAIACNWVYERLRKDPDNQLIGWYPEYESTHETYSWVASHVLVFIKDFCSFISEIISENALAYFKATKLDEDITFYDSYDIKNNIEQLKEKRYFSALVFGPPGTGKNTIARYLARELGKEDARKNNSKGPVTSWDYIEVIPGQFLASGREQIIPRANEIFKRLNRIKKAVVLFDEVDLLVAKRKSGEGKEEGDKGWIVTALLPKFADLRDLGKVKFILATNAKLQDIDEAILRVGRMDLVLPVGGLYWKDRVRMLKDEIYRIENEKSRNQLLEQIFRLSDEKSIFSLYDPNKISKKTDEEKRKEEDRLFDSVLTSGRILRDKSLECIHCFLSRTNYLSKPRLCLLLQKAFEIIDEATPISNNPLFKELFESTGKIDSFDEDTFKKFHNALLRKFVRKNVRLPGNKSIDTIARGNVYSPAVPRRA